MSKWIGPFNSGELCIKSHQWTVEGDYEIKVISRDDLSGKSEWSNPLIISIPKCKNPQFPLINWLISKINWNFPLLNFLENGDDFI